MRHIRHFSNDSPDHVFLNKLSIIKTTSYQLLSRQNHSSCFLDDTSEAMNL